jgi:signal transduction histidine kinase
MGRNANVNHEIAALPRLSVADTGPGIPIAEQARIFERF